MAKKNTVTKSSGIAAPKNRAATPPAIPAPAVARERNRRAYFSCRAMRFFIAETSKRNCISFSSARRSRSCLKYPAMELNRAIASGRLLPDISAAIFSVRFNASSIRTNVSGVRSKKRVPANSVETGSASGEGSPLDSLSCRVRRVFPCKSCN